MLFEWLAVSDATESSNGDACERSGMPDATHTAGDRLQRANAGGLKHLELKPPVTDTFQENKLRSTEDQPFVHQASHTTKPPTSNAMGREWPFPEGTSVWCDALVADETQSQPGHSQS